MACESLAPNPAVVCPTIYRGDAIVDRRSEFVGHAARVTSEAEVRAMMTVLLADKRIGKASHNMLAYRFRRRAVPTPRSIGGSLVPMPDVTDADADADADADTGILVSDNDEDGESGAGVRMSSLLELAGVEDACVLVTRWYGGVHLGPKRFAHISNTARSALSAAGLLHGATTVGSGSGSGSGGQSKRKGKGKGKGGAT